MLRNVIVAILTCIALGIASVATAADKHGHDHTPPPGVLFAEATDLDFKLVAKVVGLTLYVIDNGKSVATAGAKGMATIHAGSEKTAATFESAGENKLVAKGSSRWASACA